MATLPKGLDYAWGRPNLNTVKSAGYSFVCRYLSYDTLGKNLTKSEAGSIAAAGLSIVSNWEWDEKDALGGKAKGVQHATEALRQATAAGMPSGVPIYFSVDFDATSSQLKDVGQYFVGVVSVLGLANTGIYGGYNTIDYAYKHNLASYFWQTYAWSGGRIHTAGHLYQYSNGHTVGGADVDYDRALKSSYGAWRPGHAGTESGGGTEVSLPTETGYDYSGTIAATAALFGNIGTTMSNQATVINALRD